MSKPSPWRNPSAPPTPAKPNTAARAAKLESAETIFIATRGSALALAQANQILAQCRAAFPRLKFEIKIIKTTGDKLQTASLSNPAPDLPKGLFTKELETALLEKQAHLAVHSLKDLPTELPPGLKLGAVGKREDVRDVLLYRDAAFLRELAKANPIADWQPGQRIKRGFAPNPTLTTLPAGAIVATSSTRRRAHVLLLAPQLTTVEIRGNVPTRVQKLADTDAFDATILAAAGLARLQFRIKPDGHLIGAGLPAGILATMIETNDMIPCVGQGAIGLEIRADDSLAAEICAALDHFNTHQCVLAERAFLRAMGGGCASPVAAHARIAGHLIHVRAISFTHAEPRRAEGSRPVREAVALGEDLARQLR